MDTSRIERAHMDISIGDNHKAMLREREHQIAFLQAEQARLEAELRYVATRGAQLQNETMAWLQQTYQIAPGTPITLDSARGMLVVPDELQPTQQAPALHVVPVETPDPPDAQAQ